MKGDVTRLEPQPKSNELVTEDNAAQEFAERYGENLRYDHDVGAWFEFDGSIWRQDRIAKPLHWARELARYLAKTEPDRVRYAASKIAFASGVERFCRSDPTFAVTSEGWDKDPFLLGTPSGTVNLLTGQMLPADPKHGITRSTSVTPASDVLCPIWRRFIEETTGGDKDLARFLQQFFGYCLTGDVSEHALIFGYGGGGNGKSVTVNTMRGIMGDYAMVASMDSFAASAGASTRQT